MKSRRTAVKALGEIALRVNDLDAMQRFYQEAIGLELMKRFPNAAFFRIAEGYGGHTQVLALFDRAGERRQGPQIHRTTPQGVSQDRSTLDHVAFEIDLEVLEDEKKRLEQLGLSVETTTHEWTQWRSLYVSDPEGNTVEFVCYDGCVQGLERDPIAGIDEDGPPCKSA